MATIREFYCHITLKTLIGNRLSNGKLKDEPEEDLIFEQTKKPQN